MNQRTNGRASVRSAGEPNDTLLGVFLSENGRLPAFAQRRLDSLIAKKKAEGLTRDEARELREALDYVEASPLSCSPTPRPSRPQTIRRVRQSAGRCGNGTWTPAAVSCWPAEHLTPRATWLARTSPTHSGVRFAGVPVAFASTANTPTPLATRHSSAITASQRRPAVRPPSQTLCGHVPPATRPKGIQSMGETRRHDGSFHSSTPAAIFGAGTSAGPMTCCKSFR